MVPTVKRTAFIAQCHQGMTDGHSVFRSTLDQVQKRGYWLGWHTDIEKYCHQCDNCCRYHPGRLPRTGPLQLMITGTVMEMCHLEITGPHLRRSAHTSRVKVYTYLH